MNSSTNVKELIPEFFMLNQSDLFLNSLLLDLGIQDNGNKVNNVELPKWADTVE